jgi:hypothetical protein
MARSNLNTIENEDETETGSNESWTQPTTYHAVSATGRGRGYFVRVPNLPVLETIAREHGPNAAKLWFAAMQRFLTQIGQSRATAKGVPADAESERAAIEKTFGEIANSTLSMRGDDSDEGESSGKFNAALFATVRDRLVEALAEANYPTDEAHLQAAFQQNYEQIVEKYGEEAAARGYTPTKRGAKEDGKVKLPSLSF